MFHSFEETRGFLEKLKDFSEKLKKFFGKSQGFFGIKTQGFANNHRELGYAWIESHSTYLKVTSRFWGIVLANLFS